MPSSKNSLLLLLAKPLKWMLLPAIPAISAVSVKPAVNCVIRPNGTDTTINVCGTSATLTTQSISGYSNPSWNDGSTGNTKTVTASGTYWWQETGTNIVTNGDFSSGNTGFNSSYTYMTTGSFCPTCCCGVLSLEGTYTVGSNPNTYHTNFTAFGDHTTGSGKMLIVNGASVTGVTVWKENIPITPNTNYVFSVWATSVNPASPAILNFSINGSALGTISLSGSVPDGTWQYFTTTWNSGSTSGNVPIALVNQNTASGGNDFAVDDIVFAPVYRQNVIVNLNPIPVLAVTGANVCDTYDLTKSIVGYNTSTYTYIFKDGSGNVVSNPQNISQSGTYTIIEQNKLTGCQSAPQQATITITKTPVKPGISFP